MQYAILCYHNEKVTSAWSTEHDDAVMTKSRAQTRPEIKQAAERNQRGVL